LFVTAADELLQQALDKLVDNAVAFSSDNKITLVLEPDHSNHIDKVTVAVANNGDQIPDAQQPQLFDPMFSARNSDDGELHLGLGLYIVRMIGEAHHGRAWCRNTPTGVVVGITIPLTDSL